MTYRHITVEPMTPAIGAMISGVDLNDVGSEAVYEEIERALWAHHVVFFRKQALTPEAHKALGRRFGELATHEFMPHVEGHRDMQIVGHEGYGESGTAHWHTDVTYRARPSRVAVLRAAELPPSGGDTLWCSTGAAFDALPDPMKVMLLGLEADHDLPFHRLLRHDVTRFERDAGAETRRAGWDVEQEIRMLRENPPVTHPAVINHPVTGRLTLFVNSNWTKKFRGMDQDLSRDLLTMLWSWVKRPEFQVRFRWETDSVAIWDNFATQHYAVFDYAPARRIMQRVIAGWAEPGLDLATVPAHLRPPTALAEAAE